MGRKDLHKEPFDQGTLLKLEIFEEYLREWLPVFIKTEGFNEVNICDFFAGAGTDSMEVPGSPLRILKVIKEYRDLIIKHELKIHLLFNEYVKYKFKKMRKAVEADIDKLELKRFIFVEYYNEDFQKLFWKKAIILRNRPNLIFLDQSGVKYIPEKVFSELARFKRTDFMFFIASSFFKRFGETKYFLEYFPDLEQETIKSASLKEIHRVIVGYYRKKLPRNSKIRLYPFTIKKGQNIYGIVFGTKHVLGADKFLRIAWDKNKINGEANFDIDSDIDKQQGVLFPEMRKKTKLQLFWDDVKNFILRGKRVTNIQLYDYALDNGFLPNHIIDCLRKLRDEKIITVTGHFKINYNKCYRQRDVVKFEVANEKNKN